MLKDWLNGDAGVFRTHSASQHSAKQPDEPAYLRFSVGVAATGNPPNGAGRLFKAEFAEEIWTHLRDRPTGGLGYQPDAASWSQDALTWRHEITGPVDFITIVRAAWDGSVAVGEKLSTEDVYPDTFAQHRIHPEWELADQLVQRLGGFGDVYVTLMLAGGRFPRRKDKGNIVMRRGPLLPGISHDHVASLGRELMRAVGNIAAEP